MNDDVCRSVGAGVITSTPPTSYGPRLYVCGSLWPRSMYSSSLLTCACWAEGFRGTCNTQALLWFPLGMPERFAISRYLTYTHLNSFLFWMFQSLASPAPVNDNELAWLPFVCMWITIGLLLWNCWHILSPPPPVTVSTSQHQHQHHSLFHCEQQQASKGEGERENANGR